MSLSTHVLDTARGRPAADVAVTLARADGDAWQVVAERHTDADGRVPDLVPAGALTAGTHRLTFDTGGYAERTGQASFFPEASVTFTVTDPDEHHHVPLLLSPYGYSTYRGS